MFAWIYIENGEEGFVCFVLFCFVLFCFKRESRQLDFCTKRTCNVCVLHLTIFYGICSREYILNTWKQAFVRFVLFCFVLFWEREQTIRFFARKEHAMFVSCMLLFSTCSTGHVHVNIYWIRGSRLLFVSFCFVLFCFKRESRQLDFLHEKNMQCLCLASYYFLHVLRDMFTWIYIGYVEAGFCLFRFVLFCFKRESRQLDFCTKRTCSVCVLVQQVYI